MQTETSKELSLAIKRLPDAKRIELKNDLRYYRPYDIFGFIALGLSLTTLTLHYLKIPTLLLLFSTESVLMQTMGVALLSSVFLLMAFVCFGCALQERREIIKEYFSIEVKAKR